MHRCVVTLLSAVGMSRLFISHLVAFIASHTQVAKATRHMLLNVIPQLARKLDSRELLFVNSTELITLVHQAGVNCRYLGMLRNHVRLRLVDCCCYVIHSDIG